MVRHSTIGGVLDVLHTVRCSTLHCTTVHYITLHSTLHSTPLHTYSHTHIYVHTDIRTHTHTSAHSHMCTWTHAYRSYKHTNIIMWQRIQDTPTEWCLLDRGRFKWHSSLKCLQEHTTQNQNAISSPCS